MPNFNNLRHYLTLIEQATSDPDWWNNGDVLSKKELIKYDVEDFIDKHELKYEWKLCDVPSKLFLPHINTVTKVFKEFLKLMPSPYYDLEHEKERTNGIKDWFKKDGIEKAMNEKPVLTMFNGDYISVLDGYHRSAVAVKQHESDFIKAIVGKK